MGQEERILLAVAFVALVALVIAKFRGNGTQYIPDTGSRAINSRNYNVINWSGVGTVANIIPQASAGENGIGTNAVTAPWNDCGCYN